MKNSKTVRIGIIGFGGRSRGLLRWFTRTGHPVEIAAIADPRDPEEIRNELRQLEWSDEKTTFYTDADQMLDNEKLDGVLVGTRCSLHTKLALKVIERGLPMFLEKPISTNMDDLVRLRNASKDYNEKVVVSFPLRVTAHCVRAREIIESGQIGTVEQVQAWNDVPYAACYYHEWYRDENETQGLWLQKATHDYDYINSILRLKPIRVAAMNAKQIFKGDRPAGLSCDDCDEWNECMESPYHHYFTKGKGKGVRPTNWKCQFATDTGNEDSGSAIVAYETGMHVAYSQNFFARNSAARRGARFYGYKGTVEFDWYTNLVKVYMHHSPRVETHDLKAGGEGHGGGDIALIDSFIRVIWGEQKSVAPLNAGLLSVLMCLKAKESCLTNTFQEIQYPDNQPLPEMSTI